MSLDPWRRALVLTAFIGSLACERGPVAQPPSSPPTSSVAAGISSTPTAPPPPDAGATASGEVEEVGAPALPEAPPPMPFGVPECDTFVTRYLACVEVRVPADQQPRLMADLQENRAKWRQLATMPQASVALSLACRTMALRVKSDLTVDFGCEL